MIMFCEPSYFCKRARGGFVPLGGVSSSSTDHGGGKRRELTVIVGDAIAVRVP